jgi:hypothetical protein
MATSGPIETNAFIELKDEEADLVERLDTLRGQRLKPGAVGRLVAAGELRAVLGLEDAKLLEAARQQRPGDDNLLRAAVEFVRLKEMARILLRSGPVVVAVIEGTHSLATALRLVGGERHEYVTVTVRALTVPAFQH